MSRKMDSRQQLRSNNWLNPCLKQGFFKVIYTVHLKIIRSKLKTKKLKTQGVDFYFFRSIINVLKRYLIIQFNIAGWSSLVARRAHNPKVVGSNPAPATILFKGFVFWLKSFFNILIHLTGLLLFNTSAAKWRLKCEIGSMWLCV